MNNLLKNKSPKAMKNYMLIITVIFLVVVLVYTYVLIAIQASSNSTIAGLRERRFKNIMMYYYNLADEAEYNAKAVSEKIERELKSDKIDLNNIKYAMDNGIIPTELYDILEHTAENVNVGNIHNSRNGILILNNDKVIIDFNYSRANSRKDDDIRTFDSERSMNWNKQLYDDAFEKIFNHSGQESIIAIETVPSRNKNHIAIESAKYETLQEVFIKEGLYGLRNYQFFVPSYITNDGDIFGKKDIIKGVSQDNHKLIVIQEFNLFDQITKYHQEMFIDDKEEAAANKTEYMQCILYLLGIILISSYFAVIFIFINAYNSILDHKANNGVSKT